MAEALESFPKEIATELKWAAWNAAWHTANIRMGSRPDAVGDELRWRRHIEAFARLANELSVNDITSRVRDFVWSAAWYAANLRAGNEGDATKDQASANQALADIRESGQFSKGLSHLIDRLAWSAAWHAANFRKGTSEDALADLLRFEDCYDRMISNVSVDDVIFQVDQRAVTGNSPLLVASQHIQNPTSVPQHNKFTFQVAQSKTTGVTTRVGFEISAGIKTSVGFKLAGAELSGEISVNTKNFFDVSASESITNSEVKTYEFPVTVPPCKSVDAEAKVDQLKLDIPYTLVLRIGKVRRELHGMWSGVASVNVRVNFHERPAAADRKAA